MLGVPLCGSRVLMRLEAIGIRSLADLRGRDASELLNEVNLAAGSPIWHPPIAISALCNLIEAANLERAEYRHRYPRLSPCLLRTPTRPRLPRPSSPVTMSASYSLRRHS